MKILKISYVDLLENSDSAEIFSRRFLFSSDVPPKELTNKYLLAQAILVLMEELDGLAEEEDSK